MAVNSSVCISRIYRLQVLILSLLPYGPSMLRLHQRICRWLLLTSDHYVTLHMRIRAPTAEKFSRSLITVRESFLSIYSSPCPPHPFFLFLSPTTESSLTKLSYRSQLPNSNHKILRQGSGVLATSTTCSSGSRI